MELHPPFPSLSLFFLFVLYSGLQTTHCWNHGSYSFPEFSTLVLPSLIAWNMQSTKYAEDISVSLSYIWIKFNIVLQNFGVSAQGPASLGLSFFLSLSFLLLFFFFHLAHSFSLDVMYFTSFLSESWRAHGFLVSLLKTEPLMRKQFLTAACSSLSFSLTTLPTLECPLAKWLE